MNPLHILEPLVVYLCQGLECSSLPTLQVEVGSMAIQAVVLPLLFPFYYMRQ